MCNETFWVGCMSLTYSFGALTGFIYMVLYFTRQL
jgi:hypothetical protein